MHGLGLKGSYGELTAPEPELLATKRHFPGDNWEDGACAGGCSAGRAAGAMRVASVCTHIPFHGMPCIGLGKDWSPSSC